MTKLPHSFTAAIALLASLVLFVDNSLAAEELYSPPAADVVRTQTLSWVASHEVTDQKLMARVAKIWTFGESVPPTRVLFEKVIGTFILVDRGANQLVTASTLQNAPLLPPNAKLLERDGADPFFLANLRLYYARYLAHRQMYDAALDIFATIDVKQVVDPAASLFFEAVCQHRLLMKKEGLETIDMLLKNTEDVPVRYSTVATLMKHDLEALREKTLDEVSRKMSDVERRLNLGRGGQKVQKKEEEIIATLDEIIKKLEQQQGGGGGGGSGGNQNQSGSPADDSSVKGATAPGNVDKKRIGNQSGWGSLPPKKEARAKNLINRNFPAHYRQAIEKYFKKLANRRRSSGR